MHKFDSFEDSPPPPPHPHLNMDPNIEFSNHPHSRERMVSPDFYPHNLPLTINGGPNYPNENMNMIPYGSGMMTPDFGSYGGGGGVIIGSSGVLTSHGSGMSGVCSPAAGTLSRKGTMNSTATTLRRTSMLDVSLNNSPNANLRVALPPQLASDISQAATDTMLSHTTCITTKAPLPLDDEMDDSSPTTTQLDHNPPYHHGSTRYNNHHNNTMGLSSPPRSGSRLQQLAHKVNLIDKFSYICMLMLDILCM